MKEDIKIFDKLFELILSKESISEELMRDIDNIVIRYPYLTQGLITGVIKESDEAYRLAHYIDSYFQFLQYRDVEILKISLHRYNKAELSDKTLNPLLYRDYNKRNFNYTIYDKSPNEKILYLDQNVMSDLMDKKDEAEKIKSLCFSNNIIIVYSPNHLEEANRFPCEIKKTKFIEAIRYLTDDILFLPYDNSDKNFLAKEDPIYSLNRVKKYEDTSIYFEKLTILGQKDREMFLPEYEEKNHKDFINNSHDVFNLLSDEDFSKVMSNSFGGFVTKDNFKNILKDRDGFNLKIKSLYKALDLLGYKLEKKKNRNEPGITYDPEHLIYAFESDIFITNDERLRLRTKQIAKFIESTLEVLSYEDFLAKYSKREIQ